jgi:hypothetical protein
MTDKKATIGAIILLIGVILLCYFGIISFTNGINAENRCAEITGSYDYYQSDNAFYCIDLDHLTLIPLEGK